MNWEAIGALSELIGAISVLVTLLYLALQIRQNNLSTRAQIHQARSDQSQEFFLTAATSPDYFRISKKIWDLEQDLPDSSKLEQLDWEDLCKLRFFQIANQQRLENMSHQCNRGFLDKETYERSAVAMGRLIPLWEALGIQIRPDGEFARELDRLKKENVS